MLTWNENTRRDHSGKVVSAGYKATLPHWGETSIHPHIHHPGELFLSCHGLGIDMHPLGQTRRDGADADPQGARRPVPGGHGRHRQHGGRGKGQNPLTKRRCVL